MNKKTSVKDPFFEGITLAKLAGKEGWKKSQKKSRDLLR